MGTWYIYRFRLIFRNINDLPFTSIQDNNYTVIGQNISPNYSNYKNDIFIGKLYIIIYYELIPQIKHTMSFNIAQGILTDINNTFFLIWCLTIHRCYSVLLYMYFQLHFFFLLYTTVLLIIHVDRCRYSVRYLYHTIIKRSLYLWKGIIILYLVYTDFG